MKSKSHSPTKPYESKRKIQRTGRPVLVTTSDQPGTEAMRDQPRALRANWLGAMAGRARICGDIIGPTGDTSLDDWPSMKAGRRR